MDHKGLRIEVMIHIGESSNDNIKLFGISGVVEYKAT